METLFGSEKTRRRSWRFWLFILSPILVLGTCSVFVVKSFRAVQPAQEYAVMLHKRLEAGQYAAVYDAASPAFQRSGTRESVEKYFQEIHVKMGSCPPPKKANRYFANSTQSGTTVRLEYSVGCSNGRLNEVITYSIEDGVPKLLNYQANSPFGMK